jgi:hypothetical protein
MGIENANGALAVGKRHQAGAKNIQAMQLAIAVLVGHAQAVPTTRVTVSTLGVIDADFSKFRHYYCSSVGNSGSNGP